MIELAFAVAGESPMGNCRGLVPQALQRFCEKSVSCPTTRRACCGTTAKSNRKIDPHGRSATATTGIPWFEARVVIVDPITNIFTADGIRTLGCNAPAAYSHDHDALVCAIKPKPKTDNLAKTRVVMSNGHSSSA